MAYIIEKVAVIVHYIDGKTDEGFIHSPIRPYGQIKQEFFTLTMAENVEVLVNLSHVIRVEQSIIYRESKNDQPHKDRDLRPGRTSII